MTCSLRFNIDKDDQQNEAKKILIERILNSKISSVCINEGITDIWDETEQRMGKGYSGETFLKATLITVPDEEQKEEKSKPEDEPECNCDNPKFCPIHPYRSPCDCNCVAWTMTSKAHVNVGAMHYFEKRPYCNALKMFLPKGESK
jgi:hypothetical protein